MFRFFREFRNPSLKCERVGHIRIIEEREGYVWPANTPFSHVADSCDQQRVICSRCDQELEPWKETDRSGIHSLSMGSSYWTKLKKNKELWLRTFSRLPTLEEEGNSNADHNSNV